MSRKEVFVYLFVKKALIPPKKEACLKINYVHPRLRPSVYLQCITPSSYLPVIKKTAYELLEHQITTLHPETALNTLQNVMAIPFRVERMFVASRDSFWQSRKTYISVECFGFSIGIHRSYAKNLLTGCQWCEWFGSRFDCPPVGIFLFSLVYLHLEVQLRDSIVFD